MEDLDYRRYIIVPMCRNAFVHFPLKDRQLNTSLLVECIAAYQKDELMIQSQS